MKKLLYTSIIAIALIITISSSVHAQGDFLLEAGAAYGLEVEAIGIQAGALYGITENIRGDGNLIFFFPDSPDGVDNSLYEINLNGQYLFAAEESTSFYALAGLNYISQEVSGGGATFSTSEAGLNIGGGAEFGVGFGSVYVEAKYVLSSFDQLALGGGLRFGI